MQTPIEIKIIKTSKNKLGFQFKITKMSPGEMCQDGPATRCLDRLGGAQLFSNPIPREFRNTEIATSPASQKGDLEPYTHTPR